MTINYTYSITKLWTNPEEINGHSQAVLNVFFKVVAIESETGKTAEFNNVANLQEPESDSNFIPYSELTEEMIINMVKDSFGESAIETLEQSLANELQAMYTQPDLPWL